MTASSPILEVGQFYGATDARWQTELVTLTLLRHAALRAVPHHAHQHGYLTLLLEGGYREWIGERELAYAPLSLVFHPERFEHRDEITIAGSRFFAVEVHPALLPEGLDAVHDLSGGAAVWAMLHLLETVRGTHEQLDLEEPVAQILEQLLLAPLAVGAPPTWLGEIEAHLDAHSREPMSLGALAALAGVHPVHAARVFRAQHGCTMRTYLHRQRVVHASRLIATGMPLADAALDAGFYDQSHMTHVFKQITGFPPARLLDTLRR